MVGLAWFFHFSATHQTVFGTHFLFYISVLVFFFFFLIGWLGDFSLIIFFKKSGSAENVKSPLSEEEEAQEEAKEETQELGGLEPLWKWMSDYKCLSSDLI